jgi:hypothetical protein
MKTFVLDIIVIELYSTGGFPSKRQVNIALSYQSVLSGVILVSFWVLLWCCSGYIVVHMSFLAFYLCHVCFLYLEYYRVPVVNPMALKEVVVITLKQRWGATRSTIVLLWG